MTDYSRVYNKSTGDTVVASEFNTEFESIATASATKANKTGAPATTNNLAMLNASGDLEDSLIETDGAGEITADITGAASGLHGSNLTGDVTNVDNAMSISSGAVDTAELASGAVQKVKIQTTTVSLAGSIASFTLQPITLNSYCFFPMIHCSGSPLHLSGHATDGASADNARFAIYNTSGTTAYTYDVDYRYINA